MEKIKASPFPVRDEEDIFDLPSFGKLPERYGKKFFDLLLIVPSTRDVARLKRL